MKKRRIFLASVLAASALFSSACSNSAGSTGPAALDRPATAEDALPAEASFSPKFEATAVRLLATQDELQFFAARDAGFKTVCLAVVPKHAADGWVSGCNDFRPVGEIVKVSSAPLGASAVFVADGNDPRLLESDGWSKVHENLFIKRQ